MTNNIVEGLLGHRTRIAQEPRADWHRAEDGALTAYLERARDLDRTHALITGLLPRGWLLLALAALGPAFIAKSASPEKLAIGIGAVLLARNALGRLATGLTSLVAAHAAWQHAARVFRAAARSKSTSALECARKRATALVVIAHP